MIEIKVPTVYIAVSKSDSVPSKAYVKPPEDHVLYAKIGRVASEWSHFEQQLDSLIYVLAGVKAAIGVCLTAQMFGAHSRLNSIELLMATSEKYEPLKPIFKNLAKHVGAVQEARNRIVHDHWFLSTNSDTAAQFRNMPRSDKRHGITDVDIKAIDRTTANIQLLVQRAHALKVKAVLAKLKKIEGSVA